MPKEKAMNECIYVDEVEEEADQTSSPTSMLAKENEETSANLHCYLKVSKGYWVEMVNRADQDSTKTSTLSQEK